MNNKRIVSILLAFAMVIGMVTPPSQAYAKDDSKEFVEADYKVENVEGKSYKVYKFTDIVGKPKTEKKFDKKISNDGFEISEPITLQAVRASNPALGDELEYSVDVQWTTYDLAPGDLGTPVFFRIYDSVSKKTIAQTENITIKDRNKKYKFYKLSEWDDSGVSHETKDWELYAPNEYRFDVRLDTGASGHFKSEDIKAKIIQRANPIYRAEYYTNKTIPTITVTRTNIDDDTEEVPINNTKLSTNQYYSWAKAISGGVQQYYEGIALDIQKYGYESLENLEISDDVTAERPRMKMKAPGKTVFDRGPGTFTDNGTPYHYEVTGDHIKAHIFTIRQDLTVKFDANKGTWKSGNAPDDQTIGHSMKLGDSWADLGPINVPGENDLTPPAAKAGEKDKKFIGWNTDANATTALFTDNTYAQPITKDETFYAIYVEKPQGKAKVEYKDKATNAAILNKYKISGKDYPAELTGNKDEKIADAVFVKNDAPKFVGYEIDSITTQPVPNPPATANYTENGDYTVIYTYKKLPDIIPENEATDDVKNTYKKVLIKVDPSKGILQKKKGNNYDDLTVSKFLYYVNPVEDKSLLFVVDSSGLSAKSKDSNVNEIDNRNPWKFDPKMTKTTNPVEVNLSTSVNEDNFKGVETVVIEANFVQTKADQLKDKLEAQDIRVWVNTEDTDGSKITWKEGVKLKEANKNDETLKGLLAEATVKDLGENGTLAAPQTSRNSSKQNLPDGKKGNLKVAFDDGSALVVNDQMLYVAAEKNVVKPGEDNQIDPKKLPEGNLAVAFKLGKGVKIETKKGNETNPVLYETFYVKPNTSLEAGDIPATEVLDNSYKNNKWYNGANELAEADYTNITEAKTFIAKADEKGKGTVNVEYWADGTKLDSIEAYKLPGKTYITSKQGEEDADVKAADLTAEYFDLLGYEKDTTKGTNGIEVETNAKYLTANPATVKFNYKKIDDIVGPVTPGTTKPAGYVTIMFKADADNQNPARGNFGTNIQDVVYYVNPKTATIDKAGQKLSGKNKDNQEINKDFPTLTVTDNNSVANKQNAQGQYDANGVQQWLVDPANGIVNNKLAQTITENDTLTLTAMYLGKFNVTHKVVVKPDGKNLPDELKELTAAYDNEAKDKKGLEPGSQYDTPQNIDVNSLTDNQKKALVEEKVGKWTVSEWVKKVDNSGNVTFTLTWTFVPEGKPEPKPQPEPTPVPEVEIPGIKIRDHYTPTYPVYVSVPDKGTKVIDTLWYIFHIDKYDYEEVRNNNSTSHKMDVTPVIRNERTMLPLRYVAEAIGADVKWDPETRTATFAKDGLIATIQIDSDEIVLSNGKTVKMDSKPLNINDRILVSVVNVGNVFGLTNGNTLDGVDQDIEWDHDTRTATIYIRR
ncbi:stalk domain-containing protein [Anaerococcus lactolyticus]|uniref:stalk domain-containing protein n=1 Tax=Anaerococcus lactolyticus TaxID=33032 RepID=UPI00288B8537|nr:stalk domain-containing protein [Anaerococcus lactolyticus]